MKIANPTRLKLLKSVSIRKVSIHAYLGSGNNIYGLTSWDGVCRKLNLMKNPNSMMKGMRIYMNS
jgi:hypothetical protein